MKTGILASLLWLAIASPGASAATIDESADGAPTVEIHKPSRRLGIVAALLDNASIAAFLGAASAFSLVVLSDRVRARRKARLTVPAVLRREALLAQSHIQGTTGVRDDATKGTFSENLNLNFSSDTLRRFADELSENLTERQQMALLNIAFSMKNADELNSRAVETVQNITRVQTSNQANTLGGTNAILHYSAALDDLYAVELSRLHHVKDLIEAYLADRLGEHGEPLPATTTAAG